MRDEIQGVTVQIDNGRCKGCGRCVAVCSHQLLSLETVGTRKHAVLGQSIRCDRCDRCDRCAAACPFGAIRAAGPAVPGAGGERQLPWGSGTTPLMLAPMQGLTNRALRALFATWVKPDVLFTEFIRVKTVGGRPLSNSDLLEVGATEQGIPLVVQLVGPSREALVAAALAAQDAGARHLNLNLGCPYGRMLSGLTGGGMLSSPETIAAVLPALRRVVTGSFSVKIRAGYADPEQIFSLLPLFEDNGVDFIVLHPRTVTQEYAGFADHAITARVVRQTRLPVIANGDIRTAAAGERLLDKSGAAGLMLGRGAIADPLLFSRLRGTATSEPDLKERGEMYRSYLREIVSRYAELYCGETQQLGKVKTILHYLDDPEYQRPVKKLRKATTVKAFLEQVEGLVA